MRRYAQRSLRPLIYASVALLVLSVVAPWMWQAVRLGPTPVDDNLADEPENHVVAQSVLRRPEEETPAAEPLPKETVPETNWVPEPAVVSSSRDNPLADFAVVPLVVDVLPPVTERIELDPSLAEPSEPKPSKPPQRASESADMPSPEDLEAPLPPPVERAPSILPANTGGVWPHPDALVRQLTMLAEESPSDIRWTARVLAELDSLVAANSLSSDEVRKSLANLRALAYEVGRDPTPQIPTRPRTLRLRAAYAILRRLAVWEVVADMARAGLSTPPGPEFHPDDLAEALHQVDQILATTKAGSSWRGYLRLEALRAVTTSASPDAETRTLVRDVLRRLDSPRLDKQQHEFLAQQPFCRLAEVLLPAAQDPIDWTGLLESIEQHESRDDSRVARQIADTYQIMRWSSEGALASLAEIVNDNYRNANVRVAISAELVNRFVPPPQVMAEPVVDNVRGADVVGRSESVARLRIVLLPDRFRWKLGLEAHGNVASETESSKGPARFWNDGLGAFRVRKEVTVDRRGLAVTRAHGQADSEAFLNYFETDYDSIPLLSPLIRAIARNQYEHEQPAARSEISEKISQKASQRLDQEVDARVLQAEREFKQKLILPLDRLNLEPTPVDMETTERRLIVRYRLAGSHQLSAHTPRPQAPGNSMVSLQLHQSMLNNTLENLKLADRRIDLRTLYVEMLQRFEAKEIKIPEDLPEDVTVHFAEHDPVRISCEEGRVKLTIRLKELDHAGENVWKNFEVRGYYRPSDNQLEANLVRDGNLELVGERLRLGDQIALRAIFAKVLSRNRQLSIINKQLLMRPQLADLQVTQFVIQDGWIGVALGPKSDNMRPAPSAESEETEVTRHPLRNFLHKIR